jgi:C1A family cysteine protease
MMTINRRNFLKQTSALGLSVSSAVMLLAACSPNSPLNSNANVYIPTVPPPNKDLASIRAAIQRQGAKWQAGVTSISALSQAERRVRLGAVPPKGEPTLLERVQNAQTKYAQSASVTASNLPSSFDWRNVNGHNYITSVKDQGNCGSCVAFGCTAVVEASFQIQRNKTDTGIDLSEAQLFYCVAGLVGGNCQTGWWPDMAFDAYKGLGMGDEAYFPYTAGNQSCKVRPDWLNHAVRITGWHTITSIADMKTWLSTHGPLGTGFTVYEDFYYYTTGVYTPTTNVEEGGHCVCIVGYDDNASCWICKNSWGAGWGEQGFFRIAYGQCGIDAEMYAVEGTTET